MDDKGGFPIAGWVQGYLANVGPNYPQDYDAEIWGKYRWNNPTHMMTEASYAALQGKTQTLPSLNGRALTLFNNPVDPLSQYTGSVQGFEQILNQAKVYPWAGGAVTPAYFPITIQTLGTVTEGSQWNGWDLYYPAVNYRFRIIYAVYGTFTYLWTVKTAEDNGYPGWETRTYQWVHQEGGLEWLTGLFSNPLFMFLMVALIIIVVLIVLSIFAPGLLMLINNLFYRGAESVKSKPKAQTTVSKLFTIYHWRVHEIDWILPNTIHQ
jgi:hypothetical protein